MIRVCLLLRLVVFELFVGFLGLHENAFGLGTVILIGVIFLCYPKERLLDILLRGPDFQAKVAVETLDAEMPSRLPEHKVRLDYIQI